MPELRGKKIVVTGASRGIGRAIADLFAAEGADLMLTALHDRELQPLADQLAKQHGVKCVTHAGDVADAASVAQLYEKVHAQLGGLDALISNAGILGDGAIGMIKNEEIGHVLGVNVTGAINHLQFAARLMRRQKSGSIVLMSSIVGCEGNRGQSLYAASKAALIGLMQSAAKELGPEGIRVNAIAPGLIDTDMTKNLAEKVKSERISATPLGRIGTPQDVAQTALFLASDRSSFVSGQVIGVDGGMIM